MLTPIQLDDEFSARRTEVHNVIANSVLVPKMNITQAVSA